MNTRLQNLSAAHFDALVKRASALASSGSCCPRQCGIDRSVSSPPCGAQHGVIRVAAFHPHKGEEPPVSGSCGAGNVFFSGCTLSCVFCQNFPFSHYNNGKDFSLEEFAQKLLDLQGKGVHNLNFTTFDHYISETLAALRLVKDEIRVPIANNCSGFFMPETLSIALDDLRRAPIRFAAAISPASSNSESVSPALAAWCASVTALTMSSRAP